MAGRLLTIVALLLPVGAHAQSPDYPTYQSRGECMRAVGETYRKQMEYFYEEGLSQDSLYLDAAADVLKFERLACQKTYL